MICLTLAAFLKPGLAQDARGCDDGGLNDVEHKTAAVALLGRFIFEYKSNDHHMTQILIMPDFSSPGIMRLGFHDKNLDDNYCFNVSHFTVDDSRVSIQSVPTSGVGLCETKARCTIQLNKPNGDNVFVLIGFQLSYRSGIDHHVDEIAILEDDGTLKVAFNDKDDDTQLLYRVKYAYVPRDRFRELGQSEGFDERQEATATMPGGVAVLRGFRFRFLNGDHHVRKLGILPVQSSPNGTAYIYYSDKNGDDPFDWLYRWAILN